MSDFRQIHIIWRAAEKVQFCFLIINNFPQPNDRFKSLSAFLCLNSLIREFAWLHPSSSPRIDGAVVAETVAHSSRQQLSGERGARIKTLLESHCYHSQTADTLQCN